MSNFTILSGLIYFCVILSQIDYGLFYSAWEILIGNLLICQKMHEYCTVKRKKSDHYYRRVILFISFMKKPSIRRLSGVACVDTRSASCSRKKQEICDPNSQCFAKLRAPANVTLHYINVRKVFLSTTKLTQCVNLEIRLHKCILAPPIRVRVRVSNNCIKAESRWSKNRHISVPEEEPQGR